MAVVNVNGACERCKNEPPLSTAVAAGFGLPLYVGEFDDADRGDEPAMGDVLGLKLKLFMLVFTTSMGRKHWASGLKVLLTSPSAEELSS